MHMCVYMHTLVRLCLQTRWRCTNSACAHLCTNGVTHGTQRTHHCEKMPSAFLPPCPLASQHYRRSLHLHLNPSLLFPSSAAAALLPRGLWPGGCSRPCRSAGLPWGRCSAVGLSQKSHLHERQQHLINFQRLNL